MVFFVGKTLVIAEKPSVGRDLAGALDGPFQRRKLEDITPSRKRKQTNEEVVEAAKSPRSRAGDEAVFLESDDYVITWAVGHLVQLAEPEEYDEKWKKWRMADLPIVPPNGFKLVPRDAKAKKQLKLIETLLHRDDSRPRLGGRCRFARPRADADARDDRQARARDPGVRARAVPAGARDVPAAVPGDLVRGRRDAHLRRPRARRPHRREGVGTGRHGREARAKRTVRARTAAVRPDVVAARREPALRLLCPPHAAGGAVAVRGEEGDHVSANLVALPVRRHGPSAQADRCDAAADRGLPRSRGVRARARPVAVAARRQRR